MPKLISVLLEVEDTALGSVVTALNRMKGVASLNLLLGNTKAERGRANGHAAPNGEEKPPHSRRHPSGINAKTFLIGLLKKKKKMTRKEVGEEFIAAGRSLAASYTAGYDLKTEGLASGDAS